jgi:hypothetical protein
MASEFKIVYNFGLRPLETVEFTDTTQKCTKVHTTIDKTFSNTKEYITGTTSTSIRYKETYLTTTSAVTLSHSSIFNVSTLIRMLYVKILSAGSSGTPDAFIQLGNEETVVVYLSGVGDAVALPIYGNTNSIKILSSGATTVANVEILIANAV